MIIAIIGRGYSGKTRMAKWLKEDLKDYNFHVLQSYSTDPRQLSNCIYCAPVDYERICERDFMYRTKDIHGHDVFMLQSQFTPDSNVIYCVDDPQGVVNLQALGIPYTMLFMDSDDKTIESRVQCANADLAYVMLRSNRLGEKLVNFGRNGNYSFYLDTSKVSKDGCRVFASLVAAEAKVFMKMLETAQYSHMPSVGETCIDGWYKVIRKNGLYAVNLYCKED